MFTACYKILRSSLIYLDRLRDSYLRFLRILCYCMYETRPRIALPSPAPCFWDSLWFFWIAAHSCCITTGSFFYWGFLMNLCTFSGITLMVFQIPVNVLPERFPRSMLMSHLNMLMRCFNDRWYENWCVCQASFNTSTRHLIWLEFGLNWKWFSITSCRKRLCQDSCRFFAFFSAIQEIRETSLIKRHASLFQLS